MPPTQAQIDIHRPDRPSAHGNAGGGAIVGNRIDDLALILNPRIDDLDRRNDVFGRTQHIGQPDAWTLQLLAHDERKLDLDARLAVVGVFHLRAIGDQLIVEDVAIIRLVDHRRALHGFRRETNLVPNHPGASLDLAVRNLGRDRVGILDCDGGKRDVQLGRLFAIFLRRDQNVGGFPSVGFGQHGSSPSSVRSCNGSHDKIKGSS